MNDPRCSCPSTLDHLRAELEGVTLTVDCEIHASPATDDDLAPVIELVRRELAAPASPSLPLNAPLSAYPSLSAFGPTDGPDAA